MNNLNRLNGICAHCQSCIELEDEQLNAIACRLSFVCKRCQGTLKLDCPVQLDRLHRFICCDRQMTAVVLVSLSIILSSYLLFRVLMIELAVHIASSYATIALLVVLLARWKLRRRPALILQPAIQPIALRGSMAGWRCRRG